MGTAAARWAGSSDVERVVIMTPDKDMGQCVREDGKVVQYDRRQRLLIDADGVRKKFGVSPESIPDFLALVGDSADGYPGIPGWGKVSAGAVLTRYGHLEDIPERVRDWDIDLRGAAALATSLREHRARRSCSASWRRCVLDVPEVLATTLDDLRWRGCPPGRVHGDRGTPRSAAAHRPRPQVGRLAS